MDWHQAVHFFLFKTVLLTEFFKPVTWFFDAAFLSFQVQLDQTIAVFIAIEPRPAINESPDEIPFTVGAVLDGTMKLNEVVFDKVNPIIILDDPILGKWLLFPELVC